MRSWSRFVGRAQRQKLVLIVDPISMSIHPYLILHDTPFGSAPHAQCEQGSAVHVSRRPCAFSSASTTGEHQSSRQEELAPTCVRAPPRTAEVITPCPNKEGVPLSRPNCQRPRESLRARIHTSGRVALRTDRGLSSSCPQGRSSSPTFSARRRFARAASPEAQTCQQLRG